MQRKIKTKAVISVLIVALLSVSFNFGKPQIAQADWTEQTRLSASDAAANDYLGGSSSHNGAIDMYGDYVIVGAAAKGSNSTGSAYIFKRSGESWSQQAKLTASDGSYDGFGWSVAIDDTYAYVGAPDDDDTVSNSGSVYIFKKDGESWTETTKLVASDPESNDSFGKSIETDGDYVVASAPYEDAQASNAGAIYVFKKNDGLDTWAQQDKLTMNDGAEDDKIGVECPSIAISGDYAIFGAPDDDDDGTSSGSTYIFKKDDGLETWSQQAKLTYSTPNDDWTRFGASVSIYGDYAVVGASQHQNGEGFQMGSAFVYKRSGTTWPQQVKLNSSDIANQDYFGRAVSIYDDKILVSATRDDDNEVSGSGSAYIFERTGETWSQSAKFTASNPDANDWFGQGARIYGDYATLVTHLDDEAASNAGSVYFFYSDPPVTWDGDAGDDLWNSATNWSNNTVPTSTDEVVIDTAVTVTTNADISFNSLTIGGTAAATLQLSNDITSGADITIADSGTLEQKNTNTQTITGTLLVQNGGTLTHSDNSTTQAYEVDFSAATITVDTGGSINVDYLGFDGGYDSASDGYGTGKGFASGGGGAHCGDGGNNSANAGGTGYGDVSNPATIGSGGGAAGYNGIDGGDGGGLIILNASGDVTINGTITADGQSYHNDSGGGAGGGVKITAGGALAGTPDSFTVTGATNGGWGAGGGGGCVYLGYVSTNSVAYTDISMNGGTSTHATEGGAGVVMIKDTDSGTNGDLYSVNMGTASVGSSQGVTSLTVDTITLDSNATYRVPTGKTLILPGGSNDPLSGGDNSGTLKIDDGATFTPNATFEISNATFEIHQSATLNNASTITVKNNGTLDQRDYSTSNALSTTTLTINSGGTLTHGDNSTAQSHIVNINATTITLDAGSVITADGKGYDSSNDNFAPAGDGKAPDGTDGGGSEGGGGGAHCGNGGANNAATGGTAYGNISNPITIGAGGGSAGYNGYWGGSGGGAIILTATGTLTTNGTITADGAIGHNDGGGGAGGMMKLTADIIAGDPDGITLTGASTTSHGGGGGGGCAYINYTSSKSLSNSNITITGGTSEYKQRGGPGTVFIIESDAGDNGEVFVTGGSTGEALTPQGTASLTVSRLTLANNAIFEIGEGYTLTLDDSGNDPLTGGDDTGILRINSTGTFTPNSTFTITNTEVEIYQTATLNNAGVINIGTDGILELNAFSTSNAFSTTTININDGGTLRHGDNSTAQTNVLNLNVTDLTINSGGSINLDELGYSGGDGYDNGNGPGAGTGTGWYAKPGAGHFGNGGVSLNNEAGGTGYGDITNPGTIGSGGAARTLCDNQDGDGGDGGGLLIVNATGTITINGTITANGGDGEPYPGGGTCDGSGGAGGGVKIVADTISQTTGTISVTGGSGDTHGGGGGGGGVYLGYTTGNTLAYTDITMNGGIGYQHGGAGIVFIKQDGDDGDLYSVNNGTSGASSAQTTGSLTADTLTLASNAIYEIPTDKTLVLNDSANAQLSGGDDSGKLQITGTGRFTPTSTFDLDGASMDIYQTAIFDTNDVTIKDGTTLTQYGFSTDNALSLASLTIESGGALTHGDNTTAQTNIVNINASGDIDIQSGGTIDVDGKGYSGGAKAGNGNGPAGGTYGSMYNGAGGGHAGNGGNDDDGGIGGTGNCDITNIATIGSGGAGSYNNDNGSAGGDGGGLVILNATRTATIDGTITANGVAASDIVFDAGGGAGGAVKITAATISQTTGTISIIGGASQGGGGGGGGGCAYLGFTTDNDIVYTDITMNGGTAGNQTGGAGIAYIKQTGDDGDLYSVNNGTSGASSSQSTASVTADTLTLKSNAIYEIPTDKTLTLNDEGNDPLSGGDNTGILRVSGTGAFTPNATFEISNTEVELYQTSTLNNASTITIKSNGILEQYGYSTDNALSLTNLTIESGGTLTHGDNTTAQTNIVNINASRDIDIQDGGTIDVDGKGYSGGAKATAGNGPARGTYGSYYDGAGGGHAGNGGNDDDGGIGGTGNCNITGIATIGSSGAGSYNNDNGTTGADGGGLIILTATGTATIDGTITADGNNAADATFDPGGGAGGGVKITADTISQTTGTISMTGGTSQGGGGGGGGGCAYLGFTTNNDIVYTDITMNGGTAGGSRSGGAGVAYMKPSNGDGDLYSINGGTTGAITPQVASTITTGTFTARENAIYVISDGDTLSLTDSANNPLSSGDNTGILRVSGTGTFTPNDTFEISNTEVELYQTATLNNASTITIKENGILDLYSYSVDDELSLTNLTIESGGTLTHGSNTTAQSNILNITASGDVDIQSGGTINVDGKGYSGGAQASSGNGPAGGTYGSYYDGAGGGHGGNGGNDDDGGSGGTAYCADPPVTMGSGGAGSYNNYNGTTGANGGGLIILDITGSLTIEGDISANGNNATDMTFDPGAGAGGGINITAGTTTLSGNITASGGNSQGGGGAGGGGCTYLAYASYDDTGGSTSMAGGTTGSGADGGDGPFTTYVRAPTASTTLYSHDTDASSGGANPTNLTNLTPVFSGICNTGEGSCIKYEIQVDDNDDFSSTIWDSGSTGTEMTSKNNGERSPNITYAGGQLKYNTTYYWRIKFWNALGAGAWSTETATFYVPRLMGLYTFNEGGSVQQGQAVNIEWGSSGGEADETVKIEYSTDDFVADINTISASQTSVSAPTSVKTYEWTVPTTQDICGASTCSTVKLRISSNNDGNNYTAISENAFAVVTDGGAGIKTGRTFGNSGLYTASEGLTFSEGSAQLSSNAWRDASWLKRKEITVTNNVASQLTNFQVQVDVTYDSDMQADFDDIRFTSSDAETDIDFWLESKTDSDSATFYVEIPTIEASSTATIYMYYDNDGASSASDADATLLFYDDFDEDTSASYTSHRHYSHSSTINWTWDTANSLLHNGNRNDCSSLKYNSDLPTYQIYLEMYNERASIDDDGVGIGWLNSSNVGHGASSDDYSGGHGVSGFFSIAAAGEPGALAAEDSGFDHNRGVFELAVARDENGALYSWFNGTANAQNEYDDSGFTPDKIALFSFAMDPSPYYSYFLARKYVSSMPTISTAAEIEYTAPEDQTLVWKAGHEFTTINGFSATTVEIGTGTVKFQISEDDGSNWNYCVGDTLTTATEGYSQSTTANDITDTCLADLNAGTFNVKSYFHLESDGDSATLSNVEFNVITNVDPTAPTSLYSNVDTAQLGETNPTNLDSTTLAFSAICNDPDEGDILTKAEIQVSTDDTFSSVTHWDSGSTGTSLATACSAGERSIDILYGSFGADPAEALRLNDGNVEYYWRIKFWDDSNTAGVWSTINQFTLTDIPEVPSNIGAQHLADSEIVITWTDNSTNETGFKIERATQSSSGEFITWAEIGTVDANTVTYTDTTGNRDTVYQYRVRAYNITGNSEYLRDSTLVVRTSETPTTTGGGSPVTIISPTIETITPPSTTTTTTTTTTPPATTATTPPATTTTTENTGQEQTQTTREIVVEEIPTTPTTTTGNVATGTPPTFTEDPAQVATTTTTNTPQGHQAAPSPEPTTPATPVTPVTTAEAIERVKPVITEIVREVTKVVEVGNETINQISNIVGRTLTDKDLQTPTQIEAIKTIAETLNTGRVITEAQPTSNTPSVPGAPSPAPTSSGNITKKEALEMVMETLEMDTLPMPTGSGGSPITIIDTATQANLIDWEDTENTSTPITQEELEELVENAKTYIEENNLEETLNKDTDGDGILDVKEEKTYGTDPLKTDTDGDGISDYDEIKTHKTSATKADTDGDGIPDYDEINKYKTNPLNKDSDGDSFEDMIEIKAETNPLQGSSFPQDSDGNKIEDEWEELFQIKVKDGSQDSDGDGIPDKEEYSYGTNPLEKDTDNDGFTDAEEIYDMGSDPLSFTTTADTPVQITNLKDGQTIADNTPLIKGTAKRNTIVQIMIRNDQGRQKVLGEVEPDQNKVFMLEVSDPLQDGEYILNAREIDVKNKEVRMSESLTIAIDKSMNVNAPHIQKLGGKRVPEAVIKGTRKVYVRNLIPTLEGKTDVGNKVIATWKSVVSTSSLIADTKAGYFGIKPPKPLEEGHHEVIVYAIREKDSVISEALKVNFEVEEGSIVMNDQNYLALHAAAKKANITRSKQVNDVFGYILVGLAVFVVARFLLYERKYSRKKKS
jgi:hypothetical protein